MGEATLQPQPPRFGAAERANAEARQANNTGHPSHVYRTEDGRYLTIVPIVEAEWTRLWECLELPEIGRASCRERV